MAQIPPILPLIDENLFIPEVIEFDLEHNADKPFFTFSYPQTPGNFTVITHLEFGRAAHRVAHTLRPNRTGTDGQVIALIALADTILYQAVIAGLIIAGFVPFPISPRNSPAAIINLLQKTACRRLITTQASLKPLIDGLKTHIASVDPTIELSVEEIPSILEVYPNLGHEAAQDPFEMYPKSSIRPTKDGVCIYLHSSGSTGFPKAIPHTNLVWVHWALSPAVVDFRDYLPPLVIGCMALPSFHTLGIYFQLLAPLYGIVPACVYPPVTTFEGALPVLPTPENILEHARANKVNAIATVPAHLQSWSMSIETVEYLKTLEYLGYSGGSLAPKVGNSLVDSGVKLRPIYGTTEFGIHSRIMAMKGDERDWQYMCFHDRAKIRWVPQGDGTFELQLLTSEKHLPSVENLPDTRGYATSDLWENHPTKKYLRRIVGRIDDVIVHSSGEKTVPAPIEEVVMGSPLIQGVIMFGREREQAGIIVEPQIGHAFDVGDDDQLAVFRNKLWPVVEEASRDAPAFSRVFKEMIIVTAPDKPLPRTGKGTVMRKATLVAYEDEINALYDTVEASITAEGSVRPPLSWTVPDIETWVIEQAQDLTSTSGTAPLTPTADFFEHGFDSLGATFLRHRIVGALRSAASTIPSAQKASQGLTQNIAYVHSTPRSLSSHIYNLLFGDVPEPAPTTDTKHIEAMIAKYVAGLDALPPAPAASGSAAATVFLTGSTGNVGAEVLAALILDERVSRVYTFNRPAPGKSIRARHAARFADHGLEETLLDSPKVRFLTGRADEAALGLDRGAYSEVCREVNVVIHAAWALEFNRLLGGFEAHVRGVRNLVGLARAARAGADTRFVFASSVAAVGAWTSVKSGPVPEAVCLDAGVAVGTGYGEAKYVAERVTAQSGVRATVVRIGQVSGSHPRGAWATSDWLPILVKSSIALGALPLLNGVASWIPMDDVARALVEVALMEATPPTAANLVHPRPVIWDTMMGLICQALRGGNGPALELVPFGEWLTRLEARAIGAGVDEVHAIPAIKLLEFFRAMGNTRNGDVEAGGLPRFDTGNIRRLDLVRTLDMQDVELWLKYWRSVGFLG